ncbi:hypothetical protein V6O07_22815 [Arthrospira platensis SPKY2]
MDLIYRFEKIKENRDLIYKFEKIDRTLICRVKDAIISTEGKINLNYTEEMEVSLYSERRISHIAELKSCFENFKEFKLEIVDITKDKDKSLMLILHYNDIYFFGFFKRRIVRNKDEGYEIVINLIRFN